MNEDARNARDMVRLAYPELSDAVLAASEIDGFSEFVYVTSLVDDMPAIGGNAYVVQVANGTVHVCSASVPPRINCQTVRDLGN